MPIVVERPSTDDATEAPPATEPKLQRAWGRFLFPWLKTAVSGPMADDDLLIVNATDLAWALSIGYHELGTMPPHDEQVVNVVRRGQLCAREGGAPADSGTLMLALTPQVRAVEISGVVLQETTLYELKAIERREARPRQGRAVTP